MTAIPDATGSDGPEAVLSRGAPGGDPLAIFQLEESGDGAALRMDAAHADLRRHQQDVQAIETAVAAFENRAHAVSTSLGGLLAACEAREAAVVDVVEQLRRRAADTIDDLEGRLGEFEARAHDAGQTIMRLCDVSSRTLTALQERTKEAEEQNQSLEKCVTQLEQRAAAAICEVRHAAHAKDELQREIANCQQQIERLTTVAQGETEQLKGLSRHGEDQGGDRASSPSTHGLLKSLQFRTPNTSPGFSSARLIFGGVASALSAAIILLLGIAWPVSPVENHRPEQARPAPVLASRALTLASTSAVAPPMPLTADISHDRPEATRTAPAVPPVGGPLVVVSTPLAAKREAPTATVRKPSVSEGERPPRFVGTLLIESDPTGAAAFVNQERVGDTPVLLKDLRAGSYVVRLEYEGYQRWSTAATVSAVRHERVRAKLEPVRPR